jgi:pimeloyl-ACP methyl ester carboxylesterase
VSQSLHSKEEEFDVTGAGPPLVFVHGYGGSPSDWESTRKILETRFRIYSLKMHGIFFAGPKPGTFTQHVGQLGKILVEIHRIEQRPLKVAGSSYGGALCWGVAIQCPELIEELALVGPMPPNAGAHMRDRTLRRFIWLAFYPILFGLFLRTPFGRSSLAQVERLFHVPWLKGKAFRSRLSKLSGRKLAVILLVFYRFAWMQRKEKWTYWESRLSAMCVPILILRGEKDHLFRNELNAKFDRLFQHASIVMIEGGGHILMADKPEEVARYFAHFFSAQDKAQISG